MEEKVSVSIFRQAVPKTTKPYYSFLADGKTLK